jgi:hypothetical protein
MYFRLKSLNLCGNITRALSASGLPDLQEYPMEQRVQYTYYQGILAFRDENYRKAHEDMEFCIKNATHRKMKRQGTHTLFMASLVLNYLLPLNMLKGILPTHFLFQTYPELKTTFEPFALAIRSGDLAKFDVALMSEEMERNLVNRGVFLLVEKLRSVCVRVLFKQV